MCITVNQFSFRDLSEINWFLRTNFRDEGVDYLNNCFPETFKGKFAERKNFQPREIFFSRTRMELDLQYLQDVLFIFL